MKSSAPANLQTKHCIQLILPCIHGEESSQPKVRQERFEQKWWKVAFNDSRGEFQWFKGGILMIQGGNAASAAHLSQALFSCSQFLLQQLHNHGISVYICNLHLACSLDQQLITNINSHFFRLGYYHDKFPFDSLTKLGIICNDDILSKHARKARYC